MDRQMDILSDLAFEGKQTSVVVLTGQPPSWGSGQTRVSSSALTAAGRVPESLHG